MLNDINYRFSEKPLDLAKTKPKLAQIDSSITKSQIFRSKQNIGRWRQALNTAESVTNPNRVELLRTYQDVMLDSHLLSQINIRKNAILSQKFYLANTDESINIEETKKLKESWFQDFISISLDSIMYGFELIEFGPIDENNKFKYVKKVPEEYVCPEFNIVRKSLYSTLNKQSDIHYLKKPFSNWTIPVGDKSFGLLNSACPLIIHKKNVLGHWADFSAMFGSPLRVGHTNISDTERREQMVNQMKSMGSAAWAVVDIEDSLDFVQTAADAFQVFAKMIEVANSEISKLINSVVALSEQKSFVGSAEVQERVWGHNTLADKRLIVNVVNNKLLPFLKLHGIIPDIDLKFKFDHEEGTTVTEASTIITQMTTAGYIFNNEEISEKIGFNVTKNENIETPEINNVNNDLNTLNEVSDLYKNYLK